jgi:hypothetical protein
VIVPRGVTTQYIGKLGNMRDGPKKTPKHTKKRNLILIGGTITAGVLSSRKQGEKYIHNIRIPAGPRTNLICFE